MKRLILLMIAYPALCAAAPKQAPKQKHGPETDCMLLGMPCSGSSWFGDMIAKSNPKVRYASEKLTSAWGGASYSAGGKEGAFGGLYGTYYWNSDINFTKEVYFNLYLKEFKKAFTLFGLYRHRKHTFPTTKKHLFIEMYDQFISTRFKDAVLESVRSFVRGKKLNEEQKQVTIHVVSNYALLRDAADINVSLIEYETLMELSGQELCDYLQVRVPAQLFTKQLPMLIEQNRFDDPGFLAHKEQLYNALGVESYCQELIGFIKQMDPRMKYWSLLE